MKKSIIDPHKLADENTLPFILGGDAKFTLRSKKTGNRFTYRVSEPKGQKDTNKFFFVSVLTGTDNESAYVYIGTIRLTINGSHKFYYGIKSRIKHEATSVQAFEVVFNDYVSQRIVNPNLEVWHEGHCCRCGRTLTVPESIETGIGPECSKIKINKSKLHNHVTNI